MRLGEVVRAIVLFFALVKSIISDNIARITNESEFRDFVDNVNSGTNYLATTVYLSSDLSFSENTLEPIGNYDNYFCGIFDGQGYIINNLKMNVSNAFYTGLFGFSRGLTIRNVVLDDSCSITNSYSSNNAYVGGIIGYCYARDSNCNIKNSVNMASVVFSDNTNGYRLYLGGISGYLQSFSSSSSGYDSYMNNCANYGSVTHSGTSYVSYIGGVVGSSGGSYYSPSSSYYYYRYAYLQNCLNHGTIIHSGKTSGALYLGGITGHTYIAELHNCLSIGTIFTSNYPSSDYRGAIVGYVNSDTKLNYCYFTDDVGISSLYKHIHSTSTLDHTPSSQAAIPDAVGNLSSYSSKNGWSKWFLNENSATVTFKISEGKDFSFSSKIILVPEPVEEGNSFKFWCKDAECGEEFDPAAGNISGIAAIYAGWSKGTVTFDFGNGTTVNAVFSYNTEIIYPDNSSIPEREGYTLSWDNYHELMPARDITVTAQWTPNNYTVTFNVSGGDPLSDDEATKTVTFAEKYGDLPEPTKEGYMFVAWSTTKNENVTNETNVTTPSNHTLYAHWEEIPMIKEVKSKANTSLVIGVTVPVVVIVVAAVVIVLFIFLKNKEYTNRRRRYKNDGSYMKIGDIENVELNNQRREEYYRVVAAPVDELETNTSGNSQGVLINLYPQDYVRPTMRGALLEAGLTGEQAVYVCDACENASRRALNEGKLFSNFTGDDAAVIAMYTYDFGPGNFEHNPYRIINRSLVGRNYNNLQKASGLLYLVMSALRKLPRFTGKALYRGMRGGVNLDKVHYCNGNVITWSALSSTSPNMETTKAFLAKGSKSGKAEGTLFIIEGGWGYNIQPYSLFPDEVEILLEPDRQFKVTGVIEGEGLTFINLQMLDTPLVIPEVFGGVQKLKKRGVILV